MNGMSGPPRILAINAGSSSIKFAVYPAYAAAAAFLRGKLDRQSPASARLSWQTSDGESHDREIGVGDWINRYWKDFVDDPARQQWYSRPDQARPSGGETLREIQRRAVAAVEQAIDGAQDMPYVFVSHGDVIRAILAHYMLLDLMILRQVNIDHVSVSGLDVTRHETRLLFLNYRPGLDRFL